MKKALLFLGLAAATLSLTNCNKQEIDYRGNEGNVAIRFVMADTKTANDGLSTNWVKGDALSVFYAPAGTTEYSANTKFSFADEEAAANGVATGEATLGTGSYDWYAIYPYAAKYATPENKDNECYATIGSSKSGSQTQNGLDSKAHLAGYNYPLVGKGTFAASAMASLQMHQLTTVLAVKVKNTTSESIKVNSVSVTAPEKIIGGFYINFASDTPVITPEPDDYVSETAKVSVTGENTIAAGATGTFYLAVRPFSVSNADMTIKVIADEGAVEKTKKVTAEFKSGHIKTLNVDFDNASGPAEIITATVEQFLAASVSDTQWYQLTGTVSNIRSGNGTKYGNFDLTDETGTVYIYGLTATKVAKNDQSFASLDIKEGDKITIVTLRGEYSGTPQGGGTPPAYFVSKDGTSPRFNVDKTEFSVEANTTSVTVNVTGNVDWTAVPGDNVTVNPTNGSGDGTVTISFPANTDTGNAKEYSAHITTDATGVDEDDFEILITQAKADVSGVATVSTTMEAYAKAHECTISEGQNVVNYNELQLDDVVTMSTTGEGNCGSFWYSTGTQWRLYQNKSGNVVISLASGYKLKSVSFVYDVTNTGTLKDAAGTVVASGDVYETDASTVEFIVGNTSSSVTNGQVRITEVTIKYEQGQGTTPTPVDPTLTVTPTTLTVVKGETATIEVTTNSTGAKTWTSSDATVATVDNNGVVTGVKAGTATVTLSIAATSAYNASTAQVAVTVTEPSTGGNSVSMTMDEYVEAHECTVSAGSAVTMYTTLQLNGSVRLSTTGAPNCGSFWNTSSSNTTKQWRLYQNQGGNAIVTVAEGCELVSVKFTYANSNNGVLKDAEGNQVASNATQTVSGSSVTYTVGNTGENTNGQIRITAVEVVYTGNGTTFPDVPQTEITTSISMPGNKSVYIGETVELGATSNVEGATIIYESEDPTIATVNASGVVTGVAEGTVKVYARIAAVPGEYTAAERYCNVTVSKKPEQSDNADLFIFSELGYANAADVTTVSGTNVTLLFAKGESSNAPKYYDTGTAVRMYQNNTLNISSAKTIKKVEFSCVNNYGINSGTTFSAGTCTDGVWEGSAKSIDILNGGTAQIRIVSIKVTYE